MHFFCTNVLNMPSITQPWNVTECHKKKSFYVIYISMGGVGEICIWHTHWLIHRGVTRIHHQRSDLTEQWPLTWDDLYVWKMFCFSICLVGSFNTKDPPKTGLNNRHIFLKIASVFLYLLVLKPIFFIRFEK